jgi:hypothetical protein
MMLATLLIVGSAEIAFAQATVSGSIAVPIPVDEFAPFASISVKGKGIALRSVGGRWLAQMLQTAVPTSSLPPGVPVQGQQSQGHGGQKTVGFNVQVNDPALDHVQTIPISQILTRPFEYATQSETSVVSLGQDIVVGYNSSANSVAQFFPGRGLFLTQALFSGYSVSHDGGQTWTSGFVPPVSPLVPFISGDPSLAADRTGNVFYATLGFNADGSHGAVIVSKSTDKGSTFAPAVVAAIDDGPDKEWIAIGPDPTTPSRDNIYVTWTHFPPPVGGLRTHIEIWLARSIDGGATWTTKQLFAPVDQGPNNNSAFATLTNPVVDPSTGRLYVPFLHFCNCDADNVRVLVSDDGGDTFRFLAFNVPGAVDRFAFPNVMPGVLNDCGAFLGGGVDVEIVLHQGPFVIGNLGLRRYAQATRLIQQPAAGADRGRFVFAINSSTSPIFGDPTAGSEIRVVFSPDGGESWNAPLTIAPSTTADPQHVHPALTLTQNGNRAWIAYYVQQLNEKLRTDLALLHIDGKTLRLDQITGLSDTTFDLTPSNITRTATLTTNFDRTFPRCYDIGEYMSVTGDQRGDSSKDGVVAAWGDNRNTWTGPVGSPAPYTHAQADVFFGRVGAPPAVFLGRVGN